MTRGTKIVATLGPATDTDRALGDLIAAGVDLVRVNFSHGAFDDHARRIARVRALATKVGRVVGILGDLRGPKVRIQRFASGKALLVDGESFALDPSFAEQKRILERCRGLFYRCSGGAEARRFNRLLIDAGLIKGL